MTIAMAVDILVGIMEIAERINNQKRPGFLTKS
jgi:hypothetical protein